MNTSFSTFPIGSIAIKAFGTESPVTGELDTSYITGEEVSTHPMITGLLANDLLFSRAKNFHGARSPKSRPAIELLVRNSIAGTENNSMTATDPAGTPSCCIYVSRDQAYVAILNEAIAPSDFAWWSRRKAKIRQWVKLFEGAEDADR